MKIIKKLKRFRASFLIAVLVLVTKISFGQDPDPGGNPDGDPPAVPFEDYMHFILIAAGALFALLVIKKMKKRQAGI